LAAVGDVGRVGEFLRFGVRYINAAPATVEEFLAWFKPEFTGWSGGEVLAPDSQRTWILMMQLNRPTADEAVTNGVIRYGWVQGGVGADVTKAAAASQASFVADIDLACAHPGVFNAAAMTDLFRTINHEIAGFFEYTLSEAGIAHFALTPKE
jgi:hypothetical protein